MKSPLIKISKNKAVKNPYSGRYKNFDGTTKHGIYIRKYKNTTDKLFINNGNLMRLYKYPNINRRFSSPKINDYNLHLCGGWTFTNIKEEEVITRVIDGFKPMGFFITDKIKKWKNICEKSGLSYLIEPNHIPTEDYYNIGISSKGTFDENFNLQNLIIDYTNYSKQTKTLLPTKKIENFILSLKNIEIESYLTFDYANPTCDQDIIVTGLILGYPIETTVSIMWM